MSLPRVARPLHVPLAADLEAEAVRSRVSPVVLGRLVASPGRRTVVWKGLSTDEGRALAAAAADRELPHLVAGGDTLGSETVYLAAAGAELSELLASLPESLRSASRHLLTAPPSVVPCRRRPVPLGTRPLIMGVINVTPDSFSDGGAHLDPHRAAERAWRLAEEGADLIDIGGESTRPGADPVPESVEVSRVLPVVERLAGEFPLPLSIDTYKAGVARRTLEAGADLLNDVTGLRADPHLAEVAARFDAPLVLSHIRGMPKTMQSEPRYGDIMAEIASDLLRSAALAERMGIAREAVILDPGIGFGKTFENNLEVLRRLPELAGLGHALLVGVSRKSFIGKIVDRPPLERLEGSLAAAEAARQGGATILRVHDVAETARFLRTLGAIHGWPDRVGRSA